ncbi:SHS2 domain-containing protein [Nonomuraea thailandensis]|uniref:SHS2 domain-containing protein n=1 Tax=Nonomuraea thailandensis TaxID=1188745 RepID=A0A9X2GFA5_9ACTN|nr:archease [Nonomuraea thailandensis]MCP2357527.1 SHS2 domain-containing protein [Nonomuraea thailandensis]
MSRGHRTVPHTADIALEAWAGAREECLAEAARALVESFADLGTAPAPDGGVDFSTTGHTASGGDQEGGAGLLIALLEEVIYQVEVHGRVVVDVRPGQDGGLRLATVPAEAVEQVGAMPKAVTTHGVRFGREDGEWRARAVIDV